MKSFLILGFVTLYGVLLRAVFGYMGGFLEVMSFSFIILIPLGIGFATVALLGKSISSYWDAFFRPWLVCIAILLVTLLASMEGAICWIMVFPLFAILSGIGGVLAYAYKNVKQMNDGPGPLHVSLVMLLPLLIAFAEGDRSRTEQILELKREQVFQETPQQVWEKLGSKNWKTPQHAQATLASWIGFPRHLSSTLDRFEPGGIRMAWYERGLFFEEVITHMQTGKELVLEINTFPDKIPPTVMDEHILIGGKHLDILEDRYLLEPGSEQGTCKVTLISTYKICTPFNWYTRIWSQTLMQDMLKSQLSALQGMN